MKHQIKSIAIGAALFTLAGIGCSSDDSGPLGNVDSLIILQRPKRNDSGDIFQYDSYKPGARLVQLQPPTADGTLTTICCDKAGAEYAQIDISSYDISFDAKSIVFAGKLAANQRYGLFLLQLADGSVQQLKTDPGHDYVSPIFLPGDRIMFTTNAVVEKTAKQHQDEYERGETVQLGTIGIDGNGEELGPRNLSHRVFPSLASDGRVVFTQWDHLGDENSGHLMFVNPDMQGLRECFGKEGTGAANSTLKAREISPGRFVAIATARSRTINSGAVIDVRLGKIDTKDGVVSAAVDQSERNATFRQLTPDVPTGGGVSADTVGRYYSAYALNAKDKPDLLVSWADGPVESGVLADAGLEADFGVFMLDTTHQQRLPILNDPAMWDIFPMPLRTRTAPPIISSAQNPNLEGQTLIGSLNVYDSSLHQFKDGEIYGVRVMEGFSSEENIPRMFGTGMQEGHANLGVAKVQPDKSWSAKIPANIPVHLQPVDVYGMSLLNEPVWFSGRPGESRMCGGCHEPRERATVVTPGQLDTFAIGATEMFGKTPRANRLNKNPVGATDIVGAGWNTQVQPSLAACQECHDDNNLAGIAPYTITDPSGVMAPVTWTFNLSPGSLPPALAIAAGGGAYSKSYFSVAGPDMEAIEKAHLVITGNFKTYMRPLDARNSLMIQMLNPTQLFPTPSATRAFPGMGHMAENGIGSRPDISSKDHYMLILAFDMGGNYYARENAPGAAVY